MKRSGFKRAVYVTAPVAPLTPIANCRGVLRMASDEVVGVQKSVKAKPGKRAPTAAEARWMADIVEHGCIACQMDGVQAQPAEVHHILRGGRRLGHLYTIPLCAGHHRDGAGAPGMIARHPHKARFEKRYLPEMYMLANLKLMLGVLE